MSKNIRVIDGISVLKFTCDDEFTLCRLIHAQRDKDKSMIYIKTTHENRPLMKRLYAMATKRSEKGERQFLRDGYVGICYNKKEGAFVILGDGRNPRLQILLCSFP